MNFVSVTRLRVRSWRFLPGFFWYAIRSGSQAKQSEGHLNTLLHRDPGLVFWTVTVWRDKNATYNFRNNGAHKLAMRKLPEWCDEATYSSWEQPGEALPTFKEAATRLVQEGTVSKVKYPSPNHATRSFPIPSA